MSLQVGSERLPGRRTEPASPKKFRPGKNVATQRHLALKPACKVQKRMQNHRDLPPSAKMRIPLAGTRNSPAPPALPRVGKIAKNQSVLSAWNGGCGVRLFARRALFQCGSQIAMRLFCLPRKKWKSHYTKHRCTVRRGHRRSAARRFRRLTVSGLTPIQANARLGRDHYPWSPPLAKKNSRVPFTVSVRTHRIPAAACQRPAKPPET